MHFFNRLLKVPRRFNKSGESWSNILLYPIINDNKNMGDVLNRICWYLPDLSNVNVKFATSIPSATKLGEFVPSSQNNYLKEELINKLDIKNEITNSDIIDSDCILLWDKRALKDPKIIKNLPKVYIVDPTFYSHEESVVYRDVLNNTLSKSAKNDNREKYLSRYKELLTIGTEYKNATVFGTGPSIDKAFDYGFNKSFNIICNSIVKNDELLEHIRPNVIVFADPVFHFSPCNYSAEFRRCVYKAVKKYNTYCIMPENNAELFSEHFPEIEENVIGMPIVNNINFPSNTNFGVKSSANILTLYMLPVASSIAENIYILGADGRQKNEKYFWKHSSIAQFDDLMQSVFETHPSFFRDRIYKDYYNKHVDYLTSLIHYGESNGKKYFTLGNTYIPVLKERLANKIE